MKKFHRISALFLSLIILTTLATACKKSEEELFLGTDYDINLDISEDSNENPKEDSKKDSKEDSKENSKEDPSAGDQEVENNGSEKDDESLPSNQTDQEVHKEPDSSKDPSDDPVQNYAPEDKYDPVSSPWMQAEKKPNTGFMPSFDIDQTGFVKGTTLKDLKGKTLTMITANGAIFYFPNEKGKMLDEWDFWNSLKDSLGLKIKYIESRFDKAVSQTLAYMNAGKALDIVPTHMAGFPKYFNLSQPLDPYINMQNLNNSPGVDLMTLQKTRFGGGYRCIGPLAGVNLLWYNQDLVEEFNLVDPHTLWQQDRWDWNAFTSFLKSVPQTTSGGKQLYAYAVDSGSSWYGYAQTNGVDAVIQVDNESDQPNYINNWLDDRVLESYNMLENILESVQCARGGAWYDMFSKGTVMMSANYSLMNQFDYDDDYIYCRSHQYNWVPYPKANTENGRYSCFFYGYTMMLARKLKNQSNALSAVKFMELWATRCTEAICDYLTTSSFLNFDLEQRREYFEFVSNNVYFGMQMNGWDMLSNEEKNSMNQFWNSVNNPGLNMVSEAKKTYNLAEKAIKAALSYGQ